MAESDTSLERADDGRWATVNSDLNPDDIARLQEMFPSDRIPESFGRFVIQRKLGECGMGAVYLARDPQLDRLVALKIPRLADGGPESLQRFQREAKAVANLDHPHINRIHEVGEAIGVPYLVLAYLDGVSLSEELRRQSPYPIDRAVSVVSTLARALHYAHERGVIHRDLKPSNIMMVPGPDGTTGPVLIDFGLAIRPNTDDPRLTHEGTAMGTPAYMSPEQAAGNTDCIDKRCDVYGLGTVLYQALTGRPPVEIREKDNVASVLARVITEPPVRPSLLRPDVPPWLEAVCLRALAKDPNERFPDMASFAEALRPVPAKQSGPRRSSLRRLLPAVLVCLVAITALLWWWSRPLPPLALHWHGFVQAERKGEWVDLSLRDGITLFHGDQYRLVLSPGADCWLYVIGVDKTGPTLLFPHERIAIGNPCRAGTTLELPDGENWYTLDNQAGKETLFLLASHRRLATLEGLFARHEADPTATVAEIEKLLKTLRSQAAELVRTRGQTIEPDRRKAERKAKGGGIIQRVMELDLGTGYVVRRLDFDHAAPPAREPLK